MSFLGHLLPHFEVETGDPFALHEQARGKVLVYRPSAGLVAVKQGRAFSRGCSEASVGTVPLLAGLGM